jgi:membrane protein
VLRSGVEAAWLTIKRSLITIYNDVYDEHLFVFAAGLSYYFVLSLFPLLVSMASLLGYVPIPHLFEGLLNLMARLVPGDGMSLVRNIVSDVMSHKHTHFLTLGLVFTIWTLSSGFAAIIDGLDVVYRVRETRPVWKTRPIALGLTLLAGSLLLMHMPRLYNVKRSTGLRRCGLPRGHSSGERTGQDHGQHAAEIAAPLA